MNRVEIIQNLLQLFRYLKKNSRYFALLDINIKYLIEKNFWKKFLSANYSILTGYLKTTRKKTKFTKKKKKKTHTTIRPNNNSR